jgi:hypothetical protein
MESLSLMLGITLMLVTPILIVLYVAFVIAVPICRLLDWLGSSPPGEPVTRVQPRKSPRPGPLDAVPSPNHKRR